VLEASTISTVLGVYRPERAALLSFLGGLNREDWGRPTECPAYSVKGVATHILGDDLSLLSRQRDQAEQGLVLLAPELPGADFRTLLDSFNDRWVAAARFLSTDLLMTLLQLVGDWTADYYQSVDPEFPGESVGLFGAVPGDPSPFWHAIGREYLERWVHHSQIRRALGLPSLAERRFLVPGTEVVGAIARMEPVIPTDGDGGWAIGPMVLGPAQQAADVLTRAYTAEEVRTVVEGPAEMVALLAAVAGR
jgi:uncharacterized protein (TIGR03083 family)